MCGIAGILSFDAPVETGKLQTMLDAIRHRGPDGEGLWISPDRMVGIGNRRLSVIDLSDEGSQPMFSLDGRYCIVYNGEVYNYRELRESHIQRGVRYHGHSDTEVVLNHFALFGERALADFDGMFAFAIWDKSRHELFCARDRLGEKPFYYFYKKGHQLVFASEIKALFAAGVPRNVDHRMLYAYFRNPANPQVPGVDGGTFYHDVCRLPSATFVRFGKAGLLGKTRYWNLNLDSQPSELTFDHAAEEFNRLFTQSVVRRLRSDVPVGSSLSGGIDSSAIVGTVPLVSAAATRYNTFSARFENFAEDEGEFIEEVNRESGTVPHFVYPSNTDLARDVEDLFYFQDEPVESASAFAQWSVMRTVRDRGVTVLLDGQGGDEIAAGYHAYFPSFLSELERQSSQLAATERTALLEHLRIDVPRPHVKADRSVVGASRRGARHLKQRARHALARTAFARGKPVDTFLSRSFLWENGYDDQLLEVSTPSTLNAALHADLVDGKLETYLRYADRNSMAHSREVRLPFLSHELIEFMFTLPATYKIQSGWTKFLMRHALKGRVPQSVLWRKDKVGFAAPQLAWMSAPSMQPLIREAHDHLVREGIVNSRWKNDGRQNWQMMMAYLLLSGRSPSTSDQDPQTSQSLDSHPAFLESSPL